jgi:hypothetical protein
LRPPSVFMRSRNPCLFTRLRLRGLYVGFIPASPVHGFAAFRIELGKIAGGSENRQRHTFAPLRNSDKSALLAPWKRLFDFRKITQ